MKRKKEPCEPLRLTLFTYITILNNPIKSVVSDSAHYILGIGATANKRSISRTVRGGDNIFNIYPIYRNLNRFPYAQCSTSFVKNIVFYKTNYS